MAVPDVEHVGANAGYCPDSVTSVNYLYIFVLYLYYIYIMALNVSPNLHCLGWGSTHFDLDSPQL